jgi:hypothetical protein
MSPRFALLPFIALSPSETSRANTKPHSRRTERSSRKSRGGAPTRRWSRAIDAWVEDGEGELAHGQWSTSGSVLHAVLRSIEAQGRGLPRSACTSGRTSSVGARLDLRAIPFALEGTSAR